MGTLLLYSRIDDEQARWLRLGADGAPLGEAGEGSLAQAATAAADCRLVWVLNGEDVLLTTRRIPARGRRQLAQALPYALEDDLAQEVDTLGFVHQPLGPDTGVAVVDRVLLETGLARLRAAGLRPWRILPDLLLLPQHPGGYLYQDGARALLRHGPMAGLVCEADNLEMVLAALPHTAGEGQQPALRVEGGNPLPDGLACQQVSPALPLLRRLAAGLATAPALNLAGALVEDQGPSQRERRRVWLAAGVALLALGLLAGQRALQLRDLRQLGDDLDAAIVQTYRDTFPDGGRLVDARVQMQQALDRLHRSAGGDGGFLGALADVAPTLGGATTLRIEGMEYRNGLLLLRVRGDDIGQLDRIKQALEADGRHSVQIQAVNQGEDGVRAQFRIQGGRA